MKNILNKLREKVKVNDWMNFNNFEPWEHHYGGSHNFSR